MDLLRHHYQKQPQLYFLLFHDSPKSLSKSIASSKKSEVALKNKKSAHISTTYVMNVSKAALKSSPEKLTTTDLLNKISGYFSTTYSLNTSTADLNSSSNDTTTLDTESKKDPYFTSTYVFNTSTADLKSSSEESVKTEPENICKYALF